MDLRQYGSIGAIIFSMFAIFVSGLFFGVTYYIMDITESSFQTLDCQISDNVYFDTCQEMFDLSIYPFLALREILVWVSYFFIFALVIGLLVLGYQSGRSPALIGVLVVAIVIVTYLAIEVSNIYRIMLENATFVAIMQPFNVYNSIMLYFPWFMFFVSAFSLLISIVNYQRSPVNQVTSGDLDY